MDNHFASALGTSGVQPAQDGHDPGRARDAGERATGLFVVRDEAPHWLERLRDVLLGSIGLVVLAPLLGLLCLLIRLDSPGPAVFTHARLGQFGRPFPCFKLRTMVQDADRQLERMLAQDAHLAHQFATRHKLEDDPRVTRLGRWLRRVSLDELPQLLNVVRGEMSLVGPRPIVDEEGRRYGPHLPTVLSRRPGMTGLWQVSGRSTTSYAERVALDVEYVRTQGFRSDLAIIWRTMVLVFNRENGAV